MLKLIRRAAPVVLRDVVAVGGTMAIVYGCWLLYAPLGFIVGGAFALLAAIRLETGAPE